MFATHPLQKIPREPLIILFVGLVIGSGTFNVLFLDWGEVLVHPDAPYGIVSLEMVWTLAGLARVMGPWDETARQIALQITLWDYAYMALYGTSIATACIMLTRWARSTDRASLARRAHQGAWLAWIAAGFDALENGASLILLLSPPTNPWPLVMSVAATIKFLLIAYLLLLIGVGALSLLLRFRLPQ